MVKNRKLKDSWIVFAVIVITVVFLNSNNVVAGKMIESPYGPVKPLDFNYYKEYDAGRSFIEYEGSEFGAGVLTDLVFSLTEENIRKKRGETTINDKFIHFCGPCHGETGNGEGQFAAAGITPKPANLTNVTYMASLADSDISNVITGGSQSVGKSNLCPPWGMTFDKEWISDMVAFVRMLSVDQTAEAAQVKEAAKSTETAEGAAGVDDDEGVSIVRWIILGFATAFFIGVAVLEWTWLAKKK